MTEIKESDKLAEKLTVRSTFEISAGNVREFDALLLKIKKKQEQFIAFTLDVTCKWETMQTHIGPVDGMDTRQLTVKKLPSDMWALFVNRVRSVENEIITYLNKGKPVDEEGVVPVFSCNAKLRIEKKDKEAQKALEDDRQMVLFSPYIKPETDDEIDEIKEFLEQNKRLIESLKPDGDNITSVKFQRMDKGLAVGEPVELTSR
jgi:hypothetical protein